MKPYLSLWRDVTSAGDAYWVLSRERSDTQSDVLSTWEQGEYAHAKKAAIALGRITGHPVIEYTKQSRVCIYTPWVVTIREGGKRVVLKLHGNTLSGPGWAVDWLRSGGFCSDDAADGRDLCDAIYEAWAARGLEPVSVTVRRASPPRWAMVAAHYTRSACEKLQVTAKHKGAEHEETR